MGNKIVTVFGSSKVVEGEEEYQTALELGRRLAQEGYAVCNGGYQGTMEASARGAKEAGGKTIGVTIETSSSVPNPFIDEERKMKDWQSRLFGLVELGDAYVVLNGGTGTFVELFVSWEMMNQKLFSKPLIAYGDSVRDLIEGFRSRRHFVFNSQLKIARSIEEVLAFLQGRLMPRGSKVRP